jgi:hypothetical protein
MLILPRFIRRIVEDCDFTPLNSKLNPICHLLALLGAHPILHVSRMRVKAVKKESRFD